MIPENGETSSHSSAVVAAAAKNAPTIDTTSARRIMVSWRRGGA